MKRIYHPYSLWEDYPCGFYGSPKPDLHNKIIDFFCDINKVQKYMNIVTQEWVYSCEHNLSNKSMNRIAYLGQAAACYYLGAPNITTMYSWKFIPIKNRNISDNIAKREIKQWETRQRLKNTLIHGDQKDTIMGYQTMLQFV